MFRSNHHTCRLSPSPATPTHQTPSSDLYQLLLRHCNWTWQTPLLEFFEEDIMDENFLHIVRCDVLFNITVSLYVMPCNLVKKHQHFTKTFASTRAEGQGSRPICNGASLTNYAMLQPTVCTLGMVFCLLPVNKYFISNGNSPPIVHTTVCAVSNPIRWLFVWCGVVW